MVVLATFIIVWFLPRGERSIMHFEVNKPWPYGQFIAPYDFPILKSEAEVKHERDSLRRLYEPYFELQPRIEQQQVDAFRTAYRAHFSGVLPGSYRTYIETHLHTVYKRGIIDPADLERLQKENQESIHIYHATEATSRQVSQLFTEKSAYEYIVNDAANYHLASQMLQRLDLNLYLKSNIVFDEEKSRTLWEDMEKTLAPSSGMVVAGQSIIDRGEIVTEETEQILNSFNHEQSMRDEGTTSSDFTILLGQTLYVLIIMLCMVGYLNLFRQDYVNDLRYVLLLLALGLSFPLMALFLVRHMLLSVYLIPFAMLPIFIRVFMDSRTAFFVHVGGCRPCGHLFAARPLGTLADFPHCNLGDVIVTGVLYEHRPAARPYPVQRRCVAARRSPHLSSHDHLGSAAALCLPADVLAGANLRLYK